MSSQLSPVRRVLADKDTNASPQTVNKHDKITSPVASSKRINLYEEKANGPASCTQHLSSKIGQKRRIEEVDDAEREEEDSQNSQNTTNTTLLSDLSGSEMDVMDLSNITHSTAQTTSPSFHASQAEIGPVEPQFEIHEEMSQKTLESLHGVNLPPNNSMSFLRPSLLKDNSQVSVSMSSLIDFDQNDSQPIAGAEAGGTQDTNRKQLMDERAATLRTRLQLAFYKLQTNQASTPFSRLSQPSRSASPPPQPYFSSPTSSPHLPSRSKYINSPESRIAIARARATMQKKPAVKPLADIAMPNIKPTAFSARWQSTDNTSVEEIPSSPPDSHGAAVRPSAMPPRINTPSPAGKRQPQTPMQLSSPPGSPHQGKDTAARKVRGRETRYDGLTSSVVKGEAANSLLQLTRAGSAIAEDGITAVKCEL